MGRTRGSRRRLTRVVTGCLIVVVLAVGAVGPAAADDREPVTGQCTYEVVDPAVSYTTNFAIEDPTGLTSDGALNKAICGFHFPDSDPGENADWEPFEDEFHNVVSGVYTFSGQYSQAQASVVDDVFGREVGGLVCADLDHDHICGNQEDGEPLHRFCGTSPVVEPGADTDGDGHGDLGWGLFVAVNDWYHQTLSCDPFTAPQSTTGGVLDPAGGIFVTVSG